MLNRYNHCQSGRLPQDLSDDVDGDYIRQNLNNLKSMFRRKTMTPEMKFRRKSLKRMSAGKRTKNSLKLRAKKGRKVGSRRVKDLLKYTSPAVKSSQPTLVTKSLVKTKTSKIRQSKMSHALFKSKKSQSRQRRSKRSVSSRTKAAVSKVEEVRAKCEMTTRQ